MKPFPPKAVAGFLCKVADTRASECDCAICQLHMGEYVEKQLAGQPLTGVLDQVAHHLTICEECREECEVLSLVLREGGAD